MFFFSCLTDMQLGFHFLSWWAHVHWNRVLTSPPEHFVHSHAGVQHVWACECVRGWMKSCIRGEGFCQKDHVSTCMTANCHPPNNSFMFNLHATFIVFINIQYLSFYVFFFICFLLSAIPMCFVFLFIPLFFRLFFFSTFLNVQYILQRDCNFPIVG